MSYINGMNRDQVLLFPEVLDDYIADNNPVRVIDVYVDSLDLEALGFKYALPKELDVHPPILPTCSSLTFMDISTKSGVSS